MKLNQPNDNFVEGFVKQCNAMGVDPELLITQWVKQGIPMPGLPLVQQKMPEINPMKQMTDLGMLQSTVEATKKSKAKVNPIANTKIATIKALLDKQGAAVWTTGKPRFPSGSARAARHGMPKAPIKYTMTSQPVTPPPTPPTPPPTGPGKLEQIKTKVRSGINKGIGATAALGTVGTAGYLMGKNTDED